MRRFLGSGVSFFDLRRNVNHVLCEHSRFNHWVCFEFFHLSILLLKVRYQLHFEKAKNDGSIKCANKELQKVGVFNENVFSRPLTNCHSSMCCFTNVIL